MLKIIYKLYSVGAQVNSRWLPSHRANTLNRRFHRIGVGVVRARGHVWVTLAKEEFLLLMRDTGSAAKGLQALRHLPPVTRSRS